MHEEIKNRLESRILKDNKGCWNYTRAKDFLGYGKIGYLGKVISAHRVSYMVWKGKIPDGLTIDHLCKNPSCINPDHLEAVTLRENVLRSRRMTDNKSRKTHCINGHELTEENTYIIKSHYARKCRTCARVYSHDYNQKHKARLNDRHRLKRRERILRKITNLTPKGINK